MGGRAAALSALARLGALHRLIRRTVGI